MISKFVQFFKASDKIALNNRPISVLPQLLHNFFYNLKGDCYILLKNNSPQLCCSLIIFMKLNRHKRGYLEAKLFYRENVIAYCLPLVFGHVGVSSINVWRNV